MLCICGICIPINALWPVLLLFLKPIWNYIQSWYTGKPANKSQPPIGMACEGGTCSLPQKKEAAPLIIDGNNLLYLPEGIDAAMFSRIKGAKDGALVRFTASWCKPCKKIEPVFNALAAQYNDIVFVSVDVDENSEIAAEHGVVALPAFHFYRDGEVLGTTKGSNEEAIKDLLDVYARRPSPSEE